MADDSEPIAMAPACGAVVPGGAAAPVGAVAPGATDATGAAHAGGADPVPERTISVETSLGTLVVRRVSLGALARIARRLNATGSRDEAALLDALVREVVGERRRIEGETHQPSQTLPAGRFASLVDEDRRSIAAAVLTLEGIKAAGEGLVDDPRDLLVRRYAPMLDTDAPVFPAPIASGEAHPGGVAPTGDGTVAAQFVLFDAPPATPMRRRADDGEARSGARVETAARAQRTRLEDTVQRQGALIERQAMEREAAHAEVTRLASRIVDARGETRLYRRLATAAAITGLIVALVLAGFVLSLRRDLAAQREAYELRLAEQQHALERAAAQRAPLPAGSAASGNARRPRPPSR
ncbi:MAG: hypothetical protein KJZ83_16125 [Burkholderiaceae bacterium]|nr:hypothetical protein [Burkholderiaceae bacterium]